MKKLLFTICAFTALLGSASAFEPYLKTFTGFNFQPKPNENVGITSGIAAGFQCGQIRVESEFSYRYNPSRILVLKVDRNTYAFMGNLYVDLDINCDWTPFFGGGLGYARSKDSMRYHNGAERVRFMKDRECIAYQGMAGISCNILDVTRLSFEYRAFGFEDHLQDQSFLVSLKQYF